MQVIKRGSVALLAAAFADPSDPSTAFALQVL
jgi:hypothetical protein